MQIQCGWVTCKHNSADWTKEEVGECLYGGVIYLSPETNYIEADDAEKESLICNQFKSKGEK